MSFALVLPDACRAAEAALAQLTASIIGGKASCRLSPDDLDLLRSCINTARLELVGNTYLRELWPAPHVAIGLKNNLQHPYAIQVVGAIIECLASLENDLPDSSARRLPLAKVRKDLAAVHEILENTLAEHLRRRLRGPRQSALPITLADPDKISIREVVERYLKFLEERVEKGEFSPDSLRMRTGDLLRFVEVYGAMAVADAKQYHLTEWLDLNPQWEAVFTRSRNVTQLVACFRYAVEEGYITKCPFISPRALRGFAPATRRPAETREYVMLMRKGGRSLRLALFFLKRTGARTGEMRAICVKNLRLDVGTPHVHLVEHKTARQTGKPRIIPLDPKTVRVLRAVIRRMAKLGDLTGDEFIFTNTDGNPWDRHTFARHLRRTAKRIGIDAGIIERVSAYSLRHLYATEAIEAGVGIRQVADVLGHQKTDMVSRVYAKTTRENPVHLGNVAGQIEEARRSRNVKKKPDAENNEPKKGDQS